LWRRRFRRRVMCSTMYVHGSGKSTLIAEMQSTVETGTPRTQQPYIKHHRWEVLCRLCNTTARHGEAFSPSGITRICTRAVRSLPTSKSSRRVADKPILTRSWTGPACQPIRVGSRAGPYKRSLHKGTGLRHHRLLAELAACSGRSQNLFRSCSGLRRMCSFVCGAAGVGSRHGKKGAAAQGARGEGSRQGRAVQCSAVCAVRC
jgi:hypothetical protein